MRHRLAYTQGGQDLFRGRPVESLEDLQRSRPNATTVQSQVSPSFWERDLLEKASSEIPEHGCRSTQPSGAQNQLMHQGSRAVSFLSFFLQVSPPDFPIMWKLLRFNGPSPVWTVRLYRQMARRRCDSTDGPPARGCNEGGGMQAASTCVEPAPLVANTHHRTHRRKRSAGPMKEQVSLCWRMHCFGVVGPNGILARSLVSLVCLKAHSTCVAAGGILAQSRPRTTRTLPRTSVCRSLLPISVRADARSVEIRAQMRLACGRSER